MNVGVLGGGLQGIEAAYLLRKAGHQVILLDKSPEAPAKLLAHHFYCFDLLDADKKQLDAFTGSVEVIIPATENLVTLTEMEKIGQKYNKMFCFDAAAYNISRSKILSNKLFTQLNLPRPLSWPKAQFPLLVKPSCSSGSKDVKIILSAKELEELFNSVNTYAKELIVEEFLEGPSYSIEVAAVKGEGIALETTLLNFDEQYDCNQVVYPSGLDKDKIPLLQAMAVQLAAELQLTGVMDLEVIHFAGQLKILEIDARLPSQTPAVVYHATGKNLITYLLDCFLKGKYPLAEKMPKKNKAVIYEHLHYRKGKLFFPGEHVMAGSKGLYLTEDFFGADEAITNYASHRKTDFWVATVIITGDSIGDVRHKRQLMLEKIFKH